MIESIFGFGIDPAPKDKCGCGCGCGNWPDDYAAGLQAGVKDSVAA